MTTRHLHPVLEAVEVHLKQSEWCMCRESGVCAEREREKGGGGVHVYKVDCTLAYRVAIKTHR